jgi:hypothetical protein
MDKNDEKMARPKRRRGAILLTAARVPALTSALSEVGGALTVSTRSST